MRAIPTVSLCEIESYAKSLAKGWDTVKETFNVRFPERFFEQLRETREVAHDDTNSAGAIIQFGGEKMRLSPYGTRSALFVLMNDDFTLFFRSPKMEWAVSVEYSAAGLWEYGLEALRERALKAILREGRPYPYSGSKSSDLNDPRTWQRVSIAHFAFDFYSEEFTRAMTPAILESIVCPAPVKKAEDFSIKGQAWGKGSKLETITIGRKNNLQVQIYDKGKEITEASGKTWMFDVWKQSGYEPPVDKKAKDVWRFEIRFGADFLRDRGILTIFDLHDQLAALLTEAIFTRRLTVQSVTDRNRWRWPLHPLFVAAYREIGSKTIMVPLGRQQTESDKAKADRLKKTIAGNLRALTILSVGDMDEESARRYVDEAYDYMVSDPDRDKKNERAVVRYYFVKEAA